MSGASLRTLTFLACATFRGSPINLLTVVEVPSVVYRDTIVHIIRDKKILAHTKDAQHLAAFIHQAGRICSYARRYNPTRGN
jgi:hypothetical protein